MTKSELREFIGNLEALKYDIGDAVDFLRDLTNFADAEIADKYRKAKKKVIELDTTIFELRTEVEEKKLVIARLGFEYGKGMTLEEAQKKAWPNGVPE